MARHVLIPLGHLIAAALAAGALSTSAGAQCVSPMTLQELDQCAADADLLSVSHRRQNHMRSPSGQFDQLYALPGNSSMLMRRAGGVTAVFPRGASRYGEHEGRMVPYVPAGTTFYIGDPLIEGDSYAGAEWAGGMPDDQTRSPGRASLMSSTFEGTGSASACASSLSALGGNDRIELDPTPQVQMEAELRHRRPTVATDEAYRRRRIASLLARAAELEAGHAKERFADAQ